MDQQKTGKYLKSLRNEKKMTQEQLAQVFNVSSRTISRWETGTNLPDISLLVEIADFFDVDVRDIIEGEKSEMMNQEVREVATKMADYATEEKSKLLRSIQLLSFVGVIIAAISIFIQTRDVSFEMQDKSILYPSISVLVIMAVMTLYVTGLLDKLISNKKKRVIFIKVATIIAVIIAALRVIIMTTVIGILIGSVMFSRPEVHNDIENYNTYMSFSNHAYEEGVDTEWTKLGMDETIWPQEITDSMKIQDFKMVYYNPWDAQFLGYLVVDYSAADYAKEVDRLKAYESTDYIGYYGVQEEKTYELLAINADDYQGFVYALTDGKNRIIYAEQIFCNYFMDLDYNKYIPTEYLLDGFDATGDNTYYLEKTKNIGD